MPAPLTARCSAVFASSAACCPINPDIHCWSSSSRAVTNKSAQFVVAAVFAYNAYLILRFAYSILNEAVKHYVSTLRLDISGDGTVDAFELKVFLEHRVWPTVAFITGARHQAARSHARMFARKISPSSSCRFLQLT